MRRIIMAVIMAGIMVSMVSCGNSQTGEVPASSEAEPAQTVMTDAVKDDRTKFQTLPDEANSAFNTVINAAKVSCPLEKGFSRQYGYKGKEKVEGVDCYLFSVYDFDKDNSSVKVGDFAKAVNDELVFKLEDTGAELIELMPDEYTLSLSVKGTSVDKLLRNAASLAAEMIVAG